MGEKFHPINLFKVKPSHVNIPFLYRLKTVVNHWFSDLGYWNRASRVNLQIIHSDDPWSCMFILNVFTHIIFCRNCFLLFFSSIFDFLFHAVFTNFNEVFGSLFSTFSCMFFVKGSNMNNIYLFKVNNRNTKIMFKIFKVDEEDSRTTSLTSFWCLYC